MEGNHPRLFRSEIHSCVPLRRTVVEVLLAQLRAEIGEEKLLASRPWGGERRERQHYRVDAQCVEAIFQLVLSIMFLHLLTCLFICLAVLEMEPRVFHRLGGTLPLIYVSSLLQLFFFFSLVLVQGYYCFVCNQGPTKILRTKRL
jgi:hypothetical protein